jgi:hypothetical protein
MPAFRALLLLAVLASAVSAEPRRPEIGDIPLDRFLRGDIQSMKGRTIRVRYDFEEPEQALDFRYHRPVRHERSGSFDVVDGQLRAIGVGGFFFNVELEPDSVVVTAKAKLAYPDNMGLCVIDPRTPGRSTLFILKETFFSPRDNQTLGENVIVEHGSVPSAIPGHIEYRWVARLGKPELAENDEIVLKMVHGERRCAFGIGEEELKGAHVGSRLQVAMAGILANGGRAYVDEVTIEGTIREDWLALRRVAMFLEKDLENPANRLKRADRKVLALLRRYEAGKVELAEALEALANPKGLVFLREQLAAAIIKGGKAAAALDGLVPLLASTDRAARTFAARILAVAVDIDFGYVADASESSRTEAVGRITDYLGNREKNLAEGQKFVGGAWRTPAELEALRLRWEYAREIRTAHFLLRTNVTKEKSEDLAKLLEAGYDAFRQFLGQEPGTENLPLRIFVFAKNGEYAQWCKENGWERASSFYQLLIGERQLGLTTWQTHRNSGVLNVAARLFHRATFQGAMPMWYEEGFAAFFSKQGAYYWTPRGLVTGRLLPGNDLMHLAAAAGKNGWIPVLRLVGMEAADLERKETRRMYYLESWALMTFLTQSEEYNSRWSEFVARARAEKLDESNRRASGTRIFLECFEGRLERLEHDFIAWVRALPDRR